MMLEKFATSQREYLAQRAKLMCSQAPW
jgi:hypothetical protein